MDRREIIKAFLMNAMPVAYMLDTGMLWLKNVVADGYLMDSGLVVGFDEVDYTLFECGGSRIF